jgi:hypothetical protein
MSQRLSLTANVRLQARAAGGASICKPLFGGIAI